MALHFTALQMKIQIQMQIQIQIHIQIQIQILMTSNMAHIVNGRFFRDRGRTRQY